MESAVDETFARVGFDATADEMVEVTFRHHTSSNTYRRSRRTAMLGGGVTIGLCILFVASPLWKTGQGVAVGVVAVVLGMVVGYLAGPAYDHSSKKMVRRLIAEHLRGSQTLRCDVELRSSSLSIRQDDVEQLHKWRDVTAVNDKDIGVEIVTKNIVLIVRNRAFADRAEREAFIGHARRLAALAASEGS